MKYNHIEAMGVTLLKIVAGIILVVNITKAQDYQDYNDYGNDNLYEDYAKKQQDKSVGAVGGGGMKYVTLGGAIGWLAGAKIHSDRVSKKLKMEHQKDQKTLYAQYYNDVYKLQEQNAELVYAVKTLQQAIKKVQDEKAKDDLQRDYDEFKQPDVDGDDRISRAEFNIYVKNYLANYPGLQEKDYPRFENFDHDNDGFINFQEYSQQMALEVKNAERDQKYAQKQQSPNATKQASQKADALRGLYNSDYGGRLN